VVIAAWLVLGGVVHAQDEPTEAADESVPASAPSPENAESAAQAREHFRAGMEHFEGRRFREAIHQFELAAAIVPSADLWFNIARGHEELAEHEAAIEHYRRYLRDRVDPPDRAQVEQRIEALEEQAEAARLARQRAPTTGTLRLRSNVEGAAIQVDEREIGETPVVAPLSLGAGSHELDLRSDGYVPFRARVRVDAGVTTAAYADLVPETRFRAIRGRRIFTWIVGGLALAGLGTSIGFGAKARSLTNDAQSHYDGGDVEQGDAVWDDAQRWGTRSDYVLGGAIVLALGSVLLYFIEGRSVGTERIEPETPPRTATERAARPQPTAF